MINPDLEDTYDFGFHRAVSAELVRQESHGYDAEHDSKHDLDDLLEIAYGYMARGQNVKGAAMIVAARRWLANDTKVNSMQRDISIFMAACDQEVRKYPGIPSEEVKALRIRLMREELLGSTKVRAFGDHPLGLIPNKSDELVQSMLNDDIQGIADGLADVLVVVIGTAAAYGINVQEVFNEVHRSNMTKAVWDEDTQTFTVIKDEGGKVIKPETFSPANLEPIVRRQIALGMLEEAEKDPNVEIIEIDVPDNA